MAKRASRPTDAVLRELRAFGLGYPGAHTKSPWPGHLDLAVNDKTFAYLPVEGDSFHISCKLPRSAGVALMLPFCQPAGYGLGKSGWVDARFPEDQPLPVDMLKAWIDESYRAQAPKKLVAQLGAAAAAPAPAPAAKAKAKPKATAKPKTRSKPKARKPAARATKKRR
ncbi:MAG: MmcQ/YjbR family DNA-binding protein [Deltaproteobacteria bacterium]|nr:MmcQ/YjbR family DNA-binding protein [Kofleriaceae bacterium]